MQVNIGGKLIQCQSRFTACSILASDAIIISDLHPEHIMRVSIAIPRLYIQYSYYETVLQQTHDAVQNADQLYIHYSLSQATFIRHPYISSR